MLFSLLSGGDLKQSIISILLTLPVILIALSFHEASHAFAAYKMGDRTAYNLGRMTFNPINHLDPIGFICMLVFGYGWAKPVPINARNFKNPKRGMALSAAAGPISNLLLAMIFAILWRIELEIAPLVVTTQFTYNVFFWLQEFLIAGISLNVGFAVFNLIPIPPFDGSRIFLVLLPQDLYFKIMRYERQLYAVLMIALVLGVLDRPLAVVSQFFINLILKTVF
jgi:Zn-dependent protease